MYTHTQNGYIYFENSFFNTPSEFNSTYLIIPKNYQIINVKIFFLERGCQLSDTTKRNLTGSCENKLYIH